MDFLSRDAKLCATKTVCPSTGIDPVALGKHCKKSIFRAIKVNYMTDIEVLMPLILSEEVKVKVIHLVRDPRASVVSWFRAWLKNQPTVADYRFVG